MVKCFNCKYMVMFAHDEKETTVLFDDVEQCQKMMIKHNIKHKTLQDLFNEWDCPRYEEK